MRRSVNDKLEELKKTNRIIAENIDRSIIVVNDKDNNIDKIYMYVEGEARLIPEPYKTELKDAIKKMEK